MRTLNSSQNYWAITILFTRCDGIIFTRFVTHIQKVSQSFIVLKVKKRALGTVLSSPTWHMQQLNC